MRYEAVRLFVDRARLRLPDFELRGRTPGLWRECAGKLDGIPLAIELATARMGALAVEQVAQRLEVSLRCAQGREPDAHHQAADLEGDAGLEPRPALGAGADAVPAALGVRRGMDLEAAEAVCSGEASSEDEVLDLLGALVDKSLVVAGAAAGGARALQDARAHPPVRSREAGGERGSRGECRAGTPPSSSPWPKKPSRSWPDRSRGSGWSGWRGSTTTSGRRSRGSSSGRKAELGLRFGGALWRFWYNRGYLSEGIGWLERVLAGGEPDSDRRHG